jgi:hypothetical protein
MYLIEKPGHVKSDERVWLGADAVVRVVADISVAFARMT